MKIDFKNSKVSQLTITLKQQEPGDRRYRAFYCGTVFGFHTFDVDPKTEIVKIRFFLDPAGPFIPVVDRYIERVVGLANVTDNKWHSSACFVPSDWIGLRVNRKYL